MNTTIINTAPIAAAAAAGSFESKPNANRTRLIQYLRQQLQTIRVVVKSQ